MAVCGTCNSRRLVGAKGICSLTGRAISAAHSACELHSAELPNAEPEEIRHGASIDMTPGIFYRDDFDAGHFRVGAMLPGR